ncbi:MAG: nitrous oxide reductase accessory protein NosL [Gammaproteobacteria bacterium]
MITARHALIATFAFTLLAGCGQQSGGDAAAVPEEIGRGTACALDGMLLADFPGPKAQIHYAGQAEPEFFCDTVEMFSIHLNPEQVRAVRGMFVQDMGQADWDDPRNHWIDARLAFYVYGSTRHGAMGPTIASFAAEADAQKFAGNFGGKVLRFDDVTADMVVLDGGALHDHRM